MLLQLTLIFACHTHSTVELPGFKWLRTEYITPTYEYVHNVPRIGLLMGGKTLSCYGNIQYLLMQSTTYTRTIAQLA